ncbi:hypothetical protein V9L05_21575 (plasmid) [Bernardetia sp. Wsw4-3y2]|uniref:hypothetical protein n=1 Tax=Bernardetia sp. Wsw4-3y2 TaxID=3127471 RepID=UPI0030D16A2D
MTKKIIDCFLGIVISSITTAVTLLVTFFFTSTFPEAQEWKMSGVKQIIPMLIASLVFMFSLTLGLKHWRRNKKHLAVSLNILPFIVLCVFTYKSIEKLNYHTPFDSKEWNKSAYKNDNMAITLLKNEELIGLTKKEIIAKLGDSDEKYTSQDTNTIDILSYSTLNNYELIIYLEKGIVTKVMYKKSYF